MRIAALSLFVLAGLVSAACTDRTGGDPAVDNGAPPPNGKDLTIATVADPSNPDHAGYLASPTVSISGAAVTAVDTFDETQKGDVGTVYVQDVGSKKAWSATNLYGPSYQPGDFRVGVGDVLSLVGQYEETKTIGSTITFPDGAALTQMFRPIATFQYELGSSPVEPVDIDVNDLADADKGLRWQNMLVRVKDLTIIGDPTPTAQTNSRFHAYITSPQSGGGGATQCNAPFPKPAEIVNEMMDMAGFVAANNLQKGSTLKSVTGIVTFFCNLHLAPRSAADIEL